MLATMLTTLAVLAVLVIFIGGQWKGSYPHETSTYKTSPPSPLTITSPYKVTHPRGSQPLIRRHSSVLSKHIWGFPLPYPQCSYSQLPPAWFHPLLQRAKVFSGISLHVFQTPLTTGLCNKTECAALFLS
ncbi:hypothetical protein BDP55DRAFT_44562 [Colletotrichum godetiae]|uniref:Uncharacterized protein n=1 Tax=Colletotrichum godetiae TaxID=1209918 RepID=A0AAJ0ARQ8_9PEZI|nr:uncharacterized protein BDP55DRAFT_44562 [Colletotrichum godetiae]KAK1688442.1 hypothetical protein BDP55DRAFT_44562 [Colletotrichum godetiae]